MSILPSRRPPRFLQIRPRERITNYLPRKQLPPSRVLLFPLALQNINPLLYLRMSAPQYLTTVPIIKLSIAFQYESIHEKLAQSNRNEVAKVFLIGGQTNV